MRPPETLRPWLDVALLNADHKDQRILFRQVQKAGDDANAIKNRLEPAPTSRPSSCRDTRANIAIATPRRRPERCAHRNHRTDRDVERSKTAAPNLKGLPMRRHSVNIPAELASMF